MAIKNIDINSEQETSLTSVGVNKIIIKKIEVLEGEVVDLFNPILVKTELPTGEKYQYYIHATTFYSNTRPGKVTDIPMDITVHYCPFSNMIITPLTPKKVAFRIYYSTVDSEPIQIWVTKDLDGFTFSLTPASKEIILSKFKNARPLRSVFIGYDVMQNFEMIHGKLQKHIIPTLTDLSSSEIEQIGEIQFIDSRNNSVLKSF
jgi:hypothetical protein